MNTQHTEGPWLALIEPNDFTGATGGFAIWAEANGFFICSRSPWPQCADQSKANARLIAAAPELLRVAQRCLAMVEEGDGPPNWDWIREVIAKATTP